MPIIAINKQARQEYEILDKFEAGIKLTGSEVKSCKLGGANLKGSYAIINERGLVYLLACHISPYRHGIKNDYDPVRSRVLLLRQKEIASLIGKLKEKRYTLVPLALHNNHGLIKVELGLGRGKKQYEKRAAIKKRDIEREIGRRLKH
ncbi:MAG: SsrA-binding protein SmpB [Candidatus Komeilibacteria bacterium]|nr:SsrA-binding protein SmpB [Candidatus Komeilibacteria bacterium]